MATHNHDLEDCGRCSNQLRDGGRRGYNRAIQEVLYSVDCALGWELRFRATGAINWFAKLGSQPWTPLLERSDLMQLLAMGPVSAKVILKPEFHPEPAKPVRQRRAPREHSDYRDRMSERRQMGMSGF